MKNIIFKDITIKNFLSVGDDPLYINFQNGINLITGDNKDNNTKNGVGKSTISDALYWSLFGNTLRELKKDQIINNKTKKSCEVVINFDVISDLEKKYTIKRSLEPSQVKLFCNNEDITLSSIAATDDLIKNIIGGNEQVFQNSVIMSSDNTIPFMAQKKIEKRKFIEGILQLNIFGEMLSKIRSEFNDYKKENDILSNNFINQQKNLEIFEKQKENGDFLKKNKIENINKKIILNKQEIKSLKVELDTNNDDFNLKIKELNGKNKILKGILANSDKERTILLQNKTEINFSIQQYKKEKQIFIDKGDLCPVCNRKYCENDIDTIKNKIKSFDELITQKILELNTINSKIEAINDKITQINDGLDKIKDKNEEYTKKIQNNLLLNQKIDHFIEKNKEYEQEIQNIESESQNYDENIKECVNNIENINKNLIETKKYLNILESCKFIVSEDGVKTYIIKKILNLLNEKLNFYLKTFDAPCSCTFNEFFEENIYNENGKECSYFNFSGGERKRIDVSLLFTFQDILRIHSGTTYSLNIYDELFDSALDDVGTDKILTILKQKSQKYNESIYIISHKTNTKINVDNILFLEKINGVTRLKNS
jgi:DNA repair exonuclease SbcCD ATPase subunit